MKSFIHNFEFEGKTIRTTFDKSTVYYCFVDVCRAIGCKDMAQARAHILAEYPKKDAVGIHVSGIWMINLLGVVSVVTFVANDLAQVFGLWTGALKREQVSLEELERFKTSEIEILRRSIVGLQKQIASLSEVVMVRTIRVARSDYAITGTPRQRFYKLVQVFAKARRMTIPVVWEVFMETYHDKYGSNLLEDWNEYKSIHRGQISLPTYLERSGNLGKALSLIESMINEKQPGIVGTPAM